MSIYRLALNNENRALDEEMDKGLDSRDTHRLYEQQSAALACQVYVLVDRKSGLGG